MFKDKVLSLGGAVLIILISIVCTYLITTNTANQDNGVGIPTLPAINTPKPAEFTDEQLFLYACIDAFDPNENEYYHDLGVVNYNIELVAFEKDGLTLCYPVDEIRAKAPSDKARLLALLGLSPGTEIKNVHIFQASAENIFRPAFNTDCTKKQMTLYQCDLTDQQEEFINKIIVDAANKKIAFTRLGYTYDYKGTSVYGVTQYATDPQKGSDLQTKTLDEFLTGIK